MDKTAKKRLKIDLRFGGLAIDLHRFEFQRIGFAVVGIADLCRNIVQGRCEEIHYRIVAAPHPIFDDFGFHAAYAVFSCTRLIQTADGIKFFAVGDFQPRGSFASFAANCQASVNKSIALGLCSVLLSPALP